MHTEGLVLRERGGAVELKSERTQVARGAMRQTPASRAAPLMRTTTYKTKQQMIMEAEEAEPGDDGRSRIRDGEGQREYGHIFRRTRGTVPRPLTCMQYLTRADWRVPCRISMSVRLKRAIKSSATKSSAKTLSGGGSDCECGS